MPSRPRLAFARDGDVNVSGQRRCFLSRRRFHGECSAFVPATTSAAAPSEMNGRDLVDSRVRPCRGHRLQRRAVQRRILRSNRASRNLRGEGWNDRISSLKLSVRAARRRLPRPARRGPRRSTGRQARRSRDAAATLDGSPATGRPHHAARGPDMLIAIPATAAFGSIAAVSSATDGRKQVRFSAEQPRVPRARR